MRFLPTSVLSEAAFASCARGTSSTFASSSRPAANAGQKSNPEHLKMPPEQPAHPVGTFQQLQGDAAQDVLADPYVKSLLLKWGVAAGLRMLTFSCSKFYHKLQGQELVADLLADPVFQQAFLVAGRGGAWQTLAGGVHRFQLVPLPATETRMELFDRLASADPPIVRRTGDGDIIKCMDDFRDGFQVSDMLRQLLLCDDSEHADLYSAEEKQQLLWRLFEMLCLGGGCCQFEDQLQPYLEVTKRLYKALLSVHKSPSTGRIEVTSPVWELRNWEAESGLPLFPHASRNNLCLVVLDPLRRTAKVLYHAYTPQW